LNVAAGLAAFYLIRGNGDDGLPGKGKLPAGRHEVELVLQDLQFDTNGQLLFPDGYPAGLDGPLADPKTHPFWMPEYFGDVIVVNGKAWPKLDVAAQRYRFRLLDGANTRFYNLQFCVNDAGVSQAEHSACEAGEGNVPFYVVGNDGGLLDAPVKADHLLFSPGERYDVVADFAKYRGKKITMRNDAVTPYPSAFAKFTPKLQGRVMRFVVGDAPSPTPATTRARGRRYAATGAPSPPAWKRSYVCPEPREALPSARTLRTARRCKSTGSSRSIRSSPPATAVFPG